MKHLHIFQNSARLMLPGILFIFIATTDVQAQSKWNWWPFKINRFDQAGKFHGRWKVYLGEGKDKVLLRNGKFKHGKEVGTWRYYYPDGGLYILEKHDRNSNAYTVKRYHENGNLKMEGQAIMINNGKGVRHYWYGEWKVYNDHGNYSHTEIYKEGALVASK